MWIHETPEGGLSLMAKVFDEPSDFGIERGRVSKLFITDASGECVASYERGWDQPPSTPAARRAVVDFLSRHR